ncbi:hypothetical protein Tco_0900431 [Tanacetum coccineum]
MDYRRRNDIRTNEKIDSRIAHANRTQRKRGTNHLSGGSKGSHQCSPDDGKGRETNTHLLRHPCITRRQPLGYTYEGQRRTSRSVDIVTDGSSCIDGSGAVLILTNPEGVEHTYALRFRFKATNNEA